MTKSKFKKTKHKNVRSKKKFFRRPTYKKAGKLSQHLLRRTKAAGLPQPNTLSRTEFAALQKQWYAKAAASGFEDIEWVDHRTGRGQDSPHLRGSLLMGKTYHPGRELYYDMALAYLQHCKALKGYNRFIWKLHAHGATYDQIMAKLHEVYKNPPSKYTVFYDIEHLAKLCLKWNKKYPEGLLQKRAEDKQQIAESFLADIMATEYNWILGELPL